MLQDILKNMARNQWTGQGGRRIERKQNKDLEIKRERAERARERQKGRNEEGGRDRERGTERESASEKKRRRGMRNGRNR